MQRRVEHINNLEIAQVGLRQTNNSSTVGEALSVTRLAHFSPVSDCRCLACGIDSLDLGVSVKWGQNWDALTEQLEREKDRAVGTTGIPFRSEPCLILPSGKPPSYRWHLQWPEFHLFLGKSQAPHQKSPNVYISINARALWELSLAGVLDLIHRTIERLGGMILAIKPSRCDLAADFLIPGDLSLEFLISQRVPCHVEHTHHMRGNSLETFYHGAKSSPTRLRIYNKGLEIAKAGDKWWFLQVWNIPTTDHTWRIEFQLRRPTLKKFGINTTDDLCANLGGLWKILTEDWFSLRLDDNGNTSRCSIHPWWQMVQACAAQFGEIKMLARSFRGEPADSSWFVSHCGGCLASFAASEGITDYEEAETLLTARMRGYWETRDFNRAVMQRSIPLGVPGRLGTAEIDDTQSGKDSEI